MNVKVAWNAQTAEIFFKAQNEKPFTSLCTLQNSAKIRNSSAPTHFSSSLFSLHTDNLSDYLLNSWCWWYWANCFHRVNAINYVCCHSVFSISDIRATHFDRTDVTRDVLQSTWGLTQISREIRPTVPDVYRERLRVHIYHVLQMIINVLLLEWKMSTSLITKVSALPSKYCAPGLNKNQTFKTTVYLIKTSL